MASRFIIYGLTDPTTGLVRYVGLSKRGEERIRDHKRPHRLNERTPKYDWMRSLQRRGLSFGWVVLSTARAAEALPALEIAWIRYGREQGWPLLNASDGGEGLLNPTPETREKMAAAKRGTKRPPRSAEWIERNAAANRGRPKAKWGPEKAARKELLSVRMTGNTFAKGHRHPQTESARARIAEKAREQWRRQSKPVYDLTTGVVYSSPKEAAKALGCGRAMVGHALAGRARHAKGHVLSRVRPVEGL